MNYFSFIGAAVFALGMRAGPVAGPLSSPVAGPVAAVIMEDTSYTLHGNIGGLDTGWVFLYHPGDEPTDSVRISRGQFNLAGAVTEPEFCHLVFRKLNGENIYGMGFFLQAGVLGLTGIKDSVSSFVSSGAPIQEEYLRFSKRVDSLVDWSAWGRAKEEAVKAKNNPVMDSLDLAAGLMGKRQEQFVKEYAGIHSSSYVAVEEVLNYFSYNPDADTLQSLYHGFTPSLQSSHLGQKLKDILDRALLTGIGRPAPGFTQVDSRGNPIALSSLKGRYVLVDFWASWCGPCREENPNVLKNYRQYHSKGFTVLGVSLDDKKSKWLEAIKKDGLPWIQVSDLKGWKNEVAVLYGMEGIPMNYLVDKDGKIVAKGLRGPDLDKKLEEFLH